MILIPRPLTADDYAPYGTVVMASPRGEPGVPTNQGTARRYDSAASLDNLRAAALAKLSVFRCSPHVSRPIPIELLEKHPSSTQMFVPMNAKRYLVVVSLGGDRPDTKTLAAFVASGTQGITYKPGVWHHPMIALDRVIDFACLVFEDGSDGDCVVSPLGASERAVVDVE